MLTLRVNTGGFKVPFTVDHIVLAPLAQQALLFFILMNAIYRRCG